MGFLSLLLCVVTATVFATFVQVLALRRTARRSVDEIGRIGRRVGRLADRLEALRADALEGTPAVEPPLPRPAAEAVVIMPMPSRVEPAEGFEERVEPGPDPRPEPGPVGATAFQDEAPAPRPETAADLETAIGQRWLVRIGALVLVVGVAFFYAYAIERGWIGPGQRAISGAIGGSALIALGVLFDRRGFAPLAQGFVGCGAGVLFLDAFASHRLYGFLGPVEAIAAMAAVTAVTAAIALRWNAMPLAILAQIGGCLTPFLLDDGWPGRGEFAFPYVLLISLGFLAVAARKRWPVVEILAVAASAALFLVAPTWDVEPRPWLMTGWGCAYAASFLASAAAVPAIRREPMARRWWIVTPVLAVALAVLVEDALAGLAPAPLSLVLVAAAVAHAAMAELLGRRAPADRDGRELLRLCAAGLVVDSARFVSAGDVRTATLALAAAGALLAVLARLRGSWALRTGAAVAFVLVTGRVVAFHLHGSDTQRTDALWNADFATALASGCALALASMAHRPTRWIGLTASALLSSTVIVGEVALALTTRAADPVAGAAVVSVMRALSFTGVLLGFAAAARQTGRRTLLAIAGVYALLAAAGFADLTRWLQEPPRLFLLNPAALGALIVPLGFLGCASLLRGAAPRLVTRALAAAGVVLPLVALTIEAHRFATHAWGSQESLVDAGSAAVSVTWALYAAILLGIGISRRLQPLRLGALALLAVTLGKVAVSDLSQLDELARIASFIALGVVLMAGAWAYHRFAFRIFGGDRAAHSRS
jgi:uncharacterized membrane protein